MSKAIRISALLVGFALLDAPAFAQSKWMEIEDSISVPPFNQTADAMEDLDVFDTTGKRIAEVEEVIGTDAQTPGALAIDFDDSAGYGQTGDVAVPLDHFEMNGDQLILNADADAVSGMETYND